MPIEGNPFRPSFGTSPVVLAGRGAEITEFDIGLNGGAGAPGRSMLIRGARGMGKTVLLNALEDKAGENGWLTVRLSAGDRMIEEALETTLPKLLHEWDPRADRRRVTGLSVGQFGVDTSLQDRYPIKESFQSMTLQLSELVREQSPGSGVLFSIDELQGAPTPVLREFATAYQHLVRDDRDVAIIAAGLPEGIDRVLQDDGTTFLRRAMAIEIGGFTSEVADASIRTTVEVAGGQISPDASRLAAEVSQGYPYLVQLVGYHAWRHAPTAHIEVGDVEAVVPSVLRDLGTRVHAAAVRGLPDRERQFLEALARFNGNARAADVAQAMGVSLSNQSNIRERLEQRGLVYRPSYGAVGFTLPYLGAYLRGEASRELDGAAMPQDFIIRQAPRRPVFRPSIGGRSPGNEIER